VAPAPTRADMPYVVTVKRFRQPPALDGLVDLLGKPFHAALLPEAISAPSLVRATRALAAVVTGTTTPAPTVVLLAPTGTAGAAAGVVM
jgi:hypothetical protein